MDLCCNASFNFKIVNSQAAAISAFVPLALGIGVEPGVIVAFAAACYGYYILPTYPSDLATIQFDRSGTTHIGNLLSIIVLFYQVL